MSIQKGAGTDSFAVITPGWDVYCSPSYLDLCTFWIHSGQRPQVWDRAECWRCFIFPGVESGFVLGRSRDRRQCWVSAQGQRQSCYVSLFFSLLTFHIISCLFPSVSSTVPTPHHHLSLLSLLVVKPSSSGSAVKHQIPLPAAINTTQVQQTHAHRAENSQARMFCLSFYHSYTVTHKRTHTHTPGCDFTCMHVRRAFIQNNTLQKDWILVWSWQC